MKPKTNPKKPLWYLSIGQRPFARVLAAAALTILSAWTASAAGPVVQLIWSVEPGGAVIGAPFGQQPTLITADAAGNPSTVGLAGSVPVTVDTVPPGGLNGGARSVDIGTGANNGVIAFTGLEIDSAGGYSLSAIAGNGTNIIATPTNGVSNCQLWLDAADASTLTVTTTNDLLTWADKSGMGNNATNVTANSIANTPYMDTNVNFTGYGGQTVVGFYGTNRLNINLNPITNSTFTIIALTQMNPSLTPNNDFYIGSPFLNINGGVDHVLHIGYRNATQYTFAQYADDLNVTIPTTAPIIASHVHGAGTRYLYLNGALAGQSGIAYLGNISQANIGEGNGGSFHGDIAEIFVYNTNLTDIKRVGLENYLANKWLGQFNGGATTPSFFVSSGSIPKGINFVQQPTTTVAGATISPAVTVVVTNATGAGVSGLTVFVGVQSGTGTLGGTLSQVTDGTGTATFGDLNFTVTGQKQLVAYIPGVLTNTSSSFSIIPSTPVVLAIKTQPLTPSIAGVPFAGQPVVAVEDAFGNVVTNITDTITVSEVAGGNLSQTAGNSISLAAVAGTAAFSGLYVTNSGTIQLTFSDATLTLTTNSANVTEYANVPATMAIVQEPASTAEVGVALSPQPVIEVWDIYGNTASNGTPVTASATPIIVSGDTVEATTAGVATYAQLSLTNLGSITLTFTAGSLSTNATATSVSAGPAVSVKWTTQPGLAVAGAPFGQQPVLKTVDAGGNITTAGLNPVEWVSVHQIAGGGLLGNTLLYNIGTSGSNGVITFPNLEIDTPGTNNILTADYLGDNTVPTNGIPNCILWLDAYDQTTLTLDATGTNVIQWNDKSGTGNNGTNTGNYPVTNLNSGIQTLAYGGQHTVGFHGNNWLDVDLTPLEGNEFTVLVLDVANSAAANGNNYLFGSSYNGVDATLHMGYRAANTFTFAQYADDANYTAPANFTWGVPRLWTGRLDSSAFQDIFLNGTMVYQRTAAALPGTLIGGAVGVGNGGHYNGDIAEIIVYNRNLSDPERMEVEQYLKQKWMSNSRALTTSFTVGSLTSTMSLAPAVNGNVSLMLSGAPGQQYRILSSTNLLTPLLLWQGVATNTLNGSGTWQVTLTNNGPTRFYRAVTP